MSTPERDVFAAALKTAGDAASLAQHGPRYWRDVASCILADPAVLDAICELRAHQLNTERTGI